ncbi:hypothetical protein vseg_005551 [Gypsophila vaccaria]
MNTAKQRVLLFPLPFQGHVTPMLHLANQLHSKSFSITVIQTRFNSLDPTRFPNFTFHFLDDAMPCDSQVSSDNLVQSLTDIQQHCKEPFRECLRRVLSTAVGIAEGDRVCCLIYDSVWSFAGAVAAGFGLPRVVLRTSSMSAFVVNNCLPSLRDKGCFLPGVNPDQPIDEFPPFKVRDLPEEAHHDILAAVVEQTKASHGVICNTFEELESFSISKVRQILSIPVFPVGPMHKYSAPSTTSLWTQDESSISWLDAQAPNSVLFVSFGSIASMDRSDFLEIAWGLANSNQRFLWVVRPGLSSQLAEGTDQLPEGYLEMVSERGHIVKWAPQLEVLAHPAVGGFLTHCGWNSTVEGISEGVPMVCIPFIVDQAMNARYVSEVWKVGVVLEDGIRRDDIERGITRLMVEKEGEEMSSRAMALKECAMKSCMEGGSSYESLEALAKYISSF